MAANRPVPPTAAALERFTDRLLDDPAYRTRPLRGMGGIGAGSEDALFPDSLLVTLYGAPQIPATELGSRTPRSAARKVVRQAAPFDRAGDRGVVTGFDLITVVATSTPGPDHLYRTRQPDELIGTYLKQVRSLGGRLVLDIQPGRSSVLNEVTALKRWIDEPDVDVGIDPEWNVGRKGVPGITTGSITAKELNAVSQRLDRIVKRQDLPPKLMVVHQFRDGSIERRDAIRQRNGVQVTLNFDGIGSRPAKEAGFVALATKGLFNGFSIFYRLDANLMSPRSILDLLPPIDFLLYQ